MPDFGCLNTHTWLNTNEINFTAADFPHFAHGDLLKETLSRGVRKEHKTKHAVFFERHQP